MAPAPRTQSSAMWKRALPDRGDIDHAKSDNRVQVPANRIGIGTHLADPIPTHSGRSLFRELSDPLAVGRVQEDPVRTDELEGVPLDRVVARREDQARPGVVMLDRELDRGRGDDAEVYDVHSHRHQTRRSGVSEHGAAGAGVATQDHRGPQPVASRTQAPRAAACRATSSGVRSVPTWPRIPETLIMRVSDIARGAAALRC